MVSTQPYLHNVNTMTFELVSFIFDVDMRSAMALPTASSLVCIGYEKQSLSLGPFL